MAVLPNLKIVPFVKPESFAKGLDRAAAMRGKFVEACSEQIAAAKATAKGEAFAKTVTRYRGKGDARQAINKTVRFRPWFYQVAGVWYVAPRYGNVNLMVNGNQLCVQATGKKADCVVGVIEVLAQAAKDGGLDEVLTEASKRKSREKVEA